MTWEVHALKYAERNARTRADSFIFDDNHDARTRVLDRCVHTEDAMQPQERKMLAADMEVERAEVLLPGGVSSPARSPDRSPSPRSPRRSARPTPT